MAAIKTKIAVFLSCLALAVCMCSGSANGQTVTASITGTVTDPTGAVVPGARVVAKNVDTGVQTDATTNTSGDYTIRFLPIGNYGVTVEAAGFGVRTVPTFTLEINQTAKINASLTVNASTSNVDVQGEVAPILDTTDATLATTFTATQLSNLPLNGGNFSEVTIFQPGAVATQPTGFTGNNAIERESFNSGTPSINGNRGQANNYTLEGADNNEGQNNLIAYNPAVEALGEVRVISSNAPATYGNANGGAVVALLKSGTNQFHGSAFIYLEDYKLDANTWYNKDQTPVIAKNPYTQTQFGGTLGGPIWKRKKLFFFGDYKGVRKHTGGFTTTSVIPRAFRNGDFSALYAANGTQLYDTQNNFTLYTNNQIPIVNPVAKYLFAHPELYPTENATPTDGLMASNYQGSYKNLVVNNQFDAKIEWDPGTTNKFTAFYSAGRAYDTSTSIIPVYFPTANQYPSKLSGGSWIHNFSSAIVNEARFGFTRVRWDNSIPTDPSGVFGLSGDSIVGIPFGTQRYVGFSQQSFNGSGSVGTNANTQILRDNTFNYYDNLTWQRGRHLFSMGVQATRYQQNYLNASNFGFLGTFSYNGQFTGNPGISTGYSPADFVLDRVSQTALGSTTGIIGNRQWRSAGYFQDDFKVTPNLTLNVGVRYEYDQPWYEAHDKTANVVLVNGVAQLEYAGSIPVGAAPGATLCPTKACYNANYTQIMPRFGFAYQIEPRLVLRGGYGGTSFFEGDAFNQRLTSSPPFATGSNVPAALPTTASGGSPFTVEEGLSHQFSVTNTVYSIWPQNQQPAYISEYNLTMEYALTNTLSLSGSYLGESGHHLADYGNPNGFTLAQANIYSLLPASVQANGPYPASLNTPYMNLPGVGPGGYLLETESRAMMNYNGLLASLRQRTSHGLEFTVNYTFAKAMTDSSGNYGSSPGTSGSSGAYQNYFDSAADYGVSSNDIRHNITAIGTYALPIGHGQLYGSKMNRGLDLLVGGWKISGSVINYTGLPITINGPTALHTNNPGGGFRANQYRHFKIVNRSLNNWWGTDPSVLDTVNTPTGPVNECNVITSDNGICAYSQTSQTAGALTFGTTAINTERAPGYRQIDSSLFKDFHIYGQHAIGFRANFYNLFNISSYSNPQNNITASNFGQITNVNSPPRQIELSAHYSF